MAVRYECQHAYGEGPVSTRTLEDDEFPEIICADSPQAAAEAFAQSIWESNCHDEIEIDEGIFVRPADGGEWILYHVRIRVTFSAEAVAP